MFEIENNVEMPKKCANNGSAAKYPFREMEVGDSFFVPAESAESAHRVQINISSSSVQMSKREGAGKKFATRKVEGGVRVWRTA